MIRVPGASMRAPTKIQWLEFGLMLLVLAGLIAAVVAFRFYHRLPQPFYFGINESLLDWFVTVQYSHNSGAYDYAIFSSIYPPISFLFLRLTSLPGCYGYDPYYARDCDYVARCTIYLSYAGCFAIAWLAFWKNDRSTALMRGISYGFGLPLLFALERGNTIMVTFVCFVIGYGNISRSRFAQVVGVGLGINFKPYLLAAPVADLIKRNWRFLEQSAIATIFVFAITYSLLGEGDPMTLVKNILFFSGATVAFLWERIYYATSLESLAYLNSFRFPIRDFIDSRIVDVAYPLIFVFMYTSVALIVATLASAWTRPDMVPRLRLILLVLCLHLVTAAEGGYLFMFIVFLVFMERSRSRLTMAAVVCGYLQCIPYDIVLSHFITLDGDSWLSGYHTELAIGPAVGMIMRPVLLNVMVWLLSIDSLLAITRSWRGNPPIFGLSRPRWMTA